MDFCAFDELLNQLWFFFDSVSLLQILYFLTQDEQAHFVHFSNPDIECHSSEEYWFPLLRNTI